MSGIILESLHKTLKNEPIGLRSQVAYYQGYWKKIKSGEPVTIKQKIGDKECTISASSSPQQDHR